MTPIQQAIAILEEDALTNRIERALEVLRGVPQSSKQCGDDCTFFDMLWKWFEDERRIGAEGMRPERHEGLSAGDFKTMLDEHEAALLDSRPDRKKETV